MVSAGCAGSVPSTKAWKSVDPRPRGARRPLFASMRANTMPLGTSKSRSGRSSSAGLHEVDPDRQRGAPAGLALAEHVLRVEADPDAGRDRPARSRRTRRRPGRWSCRSCRRPAGRGRAVARRCPGMHDRRAQQVEGEVGLRRGDSASALGQRGIRPACGSAGGASALAPRRLVERRRSRGSTFALAVEHAEHEARAPPAARPRRAPRRRASSRAASPGWSRATSERFGSSFARMPSRRAMSITCSTPTSSSRWIVALFTERASASRIVIGPRNFRE